jgi:LPS-assembly lipoprotein
LQTKSTNNWFTLRRYLLAAILGLSVSLLGGCGFALRGSLDIPADLQPIFVVGKKQSQELAQAVRRQLEINQIDVTLKRRNAKLIVELEQFSPSKRSVALDHEARDAEYALFERAQITLLDSAGKVLRGPRVLEQRRLIVNDTDNPVGEQTESSIVRADMRKQLSVQMARQMEYWLKQLDTNTLDQATQ